MFPDTLQINNFNFNCHQILGESAIYELGGVLLRVPKDQITENGQYIGSTEFTQQQKDKIEEYLVIKQKQDEELALLPKEETKVAVKKPKVKKKTPVEKLQELYDSIEL